MANNEHINKVVKSTGETLIDLTGDTVTAGTLLKDVTAHDRSGAQITGTVIVAPTDVTETEDNEAYLYKSSEHDAVYDELVGGSVAWNQLVQNGNFESTSGWTGRYSTVSVSNNICAVTPSSAGTLRGLIGIETTETVSQNHKFLLSVYVLSPITTDVSLSLNGNEQKTISVTANVWKKCECVWTNNADTPKRLYALIMGNLTTSQIIQYKNAFITDLTLMFGTTIADYVYNLEQSTAGSGIAWLKSYGFFTKDYYAYNAGGLVSVNTSGKKVVSETTEITYPIQSTDLKGLYMLNDNKLYTDGDIYSADGTVTRKYGIVDLGSLEWTYYGGQFMTNINGIKSSGAAMLICSKYPMTTSNTWANMTDKTCGSIATSDQFRVNDSSYTDAATFKTAMSGVYLIYELATPTTVTASSFSSPQMVYRNGTEEYLDTRDVPIPVGGNRKYVDIPEWMLNEYFDDMRAETSTISDIIKGCMPSSGGNMTGPLEWGDGVGGIEYVPSSYHLIIYNMLADNGKLTISSAGKLVLEGHNEVKLQIFGGNFVMGERLFYMNLPNEDSENLQVFHMTYGGGSELMIDGSGYVGKSSSSREIKHDIQYIENAESYHDALMRIKPATYVYNNDKTETAKLGMIAEDIADVMPIAALTDEDGKVENYDTRAVIAMLVMEVQRLNAEIERLRGDSNAD